jgi:hypothetical protein
MDFKQYFFREFYNLTSGEEKITKMGLNTGNAHHQRLAAGTNIDRKKPYLVAKSHTNKKHDNNQVTLCLNKKQNVPLSLAQAHEIMKHYGLCPMPEDPKKAIKQTGVSLMLVSPDVYILSYEGQDNGIR